ncbi:UMP kinase [Mesomycoplasma lagogenitalium]|uniref:Uridylate kinase n=1 Tax=Mesomycoplasma lagogenitalium TaxID=171286 RepID=A0ABY8LT13_9BACT|nr:UMP kinase [Mesomycoplasma lagogenitalium]WGI36389.1 UMP kinase [Mesomycoplasma lagogenitalium]
MEYKRILLKLSGESLANKESSLAIDYKLVKKIAKQLKEVIKMGIEIAIVVGGGNFWRGTSAEKNGISRNRADYIGMLATVMNGLALQSGFEQEGLTVRVLSSMNLDKRVSEYYINEKAQRNLSKKEIVIFVGGTGRPFFTTDTAATLFASEIKANVIFVGKNNVSGVYDEDPKINPNAKRYDEITYEEVLKKNLKVMDSTSFSMARDNNIELIVFNINEENSIIRAVKGEIEHTKVRN